MGKDNVQSRQTQIIEERRIGKKVTQFYGGYPGHEPGWSLKNVGDFRQRTAQKAVKLLYFTFQKWRNVQ